MFSLPYFSSNTFFAKKQNFPDISAQNTKRQAEKDSRKNSKILISLLFSAGILVTIGVIGAVTASAGRMLGDVGRYGK